MTKHVVIELDERALTALLEGNDVNLGPIVTGTRVTLRRRDAPKTNAQKPKTIDELQGAPLT